MKLYVDLTDLQAHPGRWAALLAGVGVTGKLSRAAELSRVLGYLAREFSSVRKALVRRREGKTVVGRERYVLRPVSSLRLAGPLAGQWLGLVCEYHEATRALIVVDREAVDQGPLSAAERLFSGEVCYESTRLAPAYCDTAAVAFLRALPVPVQAETAAAPLFADWRAYLDWRRRLAETRAAEAYPYVECDARDRRLVRFYLRNVGDPETLRRRFHEEELRVAHDPKETRAPQGLFRRLRTESDGTVVVEVDFSGAGRDAPRFPETGVLRIVMEGELAALDVQFDGLRRLNEGRAANPKLAAWLVDPGTLPGDVAPPDGGDWTADGPLNPEQRACVERVLALEDMLLLWGPPGTGKTTVIAEICSQLARRGRRVLVASQANLAVDQALGRLPALPHLRPAWVSTARRREGAAGDLGSCLRAWLGSVGEAVKADLKSLSDAGTSPGDRGDHRRWSHLLKGWAKRCTTATADDFSTEDEAFYLKQANVIGATCNEAGKPEFVASPRFESRFDLVVVDEVSKATPTELLPPLLLGRRVLLVGDHRQLPPLFREEPFEEAVEQGELAREALERFRRLVTASWFDDAFRRAPAAARCALRRQYRMHPQIMAAVNLFYADQPLAAGDGAEALGKAKAHGLHLRGLGGHAWLHPKNHLAWIDTSRDELGRPAHAQRIGTSRRNAVEAGVCARVLTELAAQPAARALSVVVISFYKAQVGLLREQLRRADLPAEWFDPARDVNTVDQFQGSERDIVIVSLVRTEHRLTGEFVRDFRRLNVAFSRARRLLLILGSEPTFGQALVSVPAARDGAAEDRTVYREIHDLACTPEGDAA